MRSVWVAAGLALSLTACGPGGEEAKAAPDAAAAAAAAPSEAPGVAATGEFVTTESLIEALYAEPSIPTEAGPVRRFFADAFVTPLVPTADGAVVDFDYRIDGQDGVADGLVVTETAGGPDGGVVEAKFTNMGEPRKVVWTVCRQPDGALKIVEAATEGATGWSLRRLTSLPEVPEGCA